ncbi:hypothetical protein [Arthrobacter sp. OY3WO11]|uniref:hypothetical protein n=1 Tax=Arthrobacter sp. OY3WO11 TaxID=1835723 RepID=UPI0007CF8545|nr:hypothetical protein [Arthrobacter sp. OY3WO11]OAE01876.1 hypothetical protein A6A22_10945 [Arthrobacter sp. OY3WO11]
MSVIDDKIRETLGLWANSVQNHPDFSQQIITLEEALVRIKAVVDEELIGEDEPRTPLWEPHENFIRMGRNQLRREQRCGLANIEEANR